MRTIILCGLGVLNAIIAIAACSSFSNDPAEPPTVPDASMDDVIAPPPNDASVLDAADAGNDAGPQLSYDEVIRDAGPLAFWRMESDAGTVADESGRQTATLELTDGATYGKDGVEGHSIGLNGTTGRMTALPSGAFQFENTNPFTVELWARRGGLAAVGTSYLFFDGPPNGNPGSDDRYFLRLDTDAGTVRFARGGSPLIQTSPLSFPGDQRFHYIAAVYDGSTIFCAVDDGISNQLNATAELTVNTRSFLIGLLSGSAAGYAGDIDEFAVYDRALTTKELTFHYKAGNVPH